MGSPSLGSVDPHIEAPWDLPAHSVLESMSSLRPPSVVDILVADLVADLVAALVAAAAAVAGIGLPASAAAAPSPLAAACLAAASAVPTPLQHDVMEDVLTGPSRADHAALPPGAVAEVDSLEVEASIVLAG